MSKRVNPCSECWKWTQTSWQAHSLNFSFFLSSRFIYEPILIKNYMNANIIWIGMTSKVIEGHKSSSNFSVIQPFPYWMVCWCFALKLVWISLSLSFSLTLHLVLSSPLFLSLYIPHYVPLLLPTLI